MATIQPNIRTINATTENGSDGGDAKSISAFAPSRAARRNIYKKGAPGITGEGLQHQYILADS
jgi:hypothetical protein